VLIVTHNLQLVPWDQRSEITPVPADTDLAFYHVRSGRGTMGTMDDFVKCLALGFFWTGAPFLGVGCADAERIEPPVAVSVEHTVSFVGHVFDGVTGARLTGYAISALMENEATDGTVDPAGRFSIGALSVWQDYTIEVDADGYRAFQSHNRRVGLPAELAQSDSISEYGTHQTLHYAAYLFPSGLVAPAVTFLVTTPLGAAPSGTVRFRPISSSLLADEPSETPVGVPGQLWTNDEDLLAATWVDDFQGGTIAIGAGVLVYGVTYQVDIFGVAGFQPFSGTYTAGVETNKTFPLVEEIAEPLAVVSSSHGSCSAPSAAATSGAVVTIELNANVEAHDSGYPGGAIEAADDGISITSYDDDMDGIINTLNPDLSDNAQERGVSLVFSGSTITLSWNPSIGLAIADPDDAITEVVYGGLGNIVVRRVGSTSSATSLAALLGIGSIHCY
jgi:hypothetical protein